MNKRTLWKIHSIIGLIVAVPLLLAAITGSVLVFKPELKALFTPQEVLAEPTGEGRLTWDRLHATVRQAYPEHHIVGWHRMEDKGEADEVYLIAYGDSEWLKTTIDPYRGAILAEPAVHDDIGVYFFDWLVDFHYTYLMGHLGMLIGGIVALLLCVLGVLGFFIYRQFWVGFFTLRWGKSWRVLMGDIHSRLGVLSSVVFIVLGFTGAYWNLTHAIPDIWNHGLFEHEEAALPSEPMYSQDISLSAMVEDSQKAIEGYRAYYLSFPWEPGVDFTFWGAVSSGHFLRSPYGSTVVYDHQTGERKSVSDIREANGFYQTVDTFYRLHFGTFGGLTIKIIWCVLGFAPALLALSGTFVWWKRKRRGKRV